MKHKWTVDDDRVIALYLLETNFSLKGIRKAANELGLSYSSVYSRYRRNIGKIRNLADDIIYESYNKKSSGKKIPFIGFLYSIFRKVVHYLNN